MNFIFSIVGIIVLFFIITAGGDILIAQGLLPDALVPTYGFLIGLRDQVIAFYAYLLHYFQ